MKWRKYANVIVTRVGPELARDSKSSMSRLSFEARGGSCLVRSEFKSARLAS